jgi:hypothetical protein
MLKNCDGKSGMGIPAFVLSWCAFLLCGCQGQAVPPYPPSDLIDSIFFDWSTHLRLAPGSDNWPVTWADDGHQYTTWGDGGGFGGTNADGRVSLGVARVEGSRDSYTGFNVWGGKDGENAALFKGKSYGIISISGVLFMWVSPGSNARGYEEARLYTSSDHGATWQSAEWAFARSQGLVNPTFCQFGMDYAGSRDDYVYIYANHIKDSSALKVQKPGEIALLRVPVASLTGQQAYEYFAGFDDDQVPVWTSQIDERQPVFRDPGGVGWNTSVSYNAGLRRYLLITEHDITAEANLGIFDAPEPWGPWTTVYYGKFGVGSNIPENSFFYNFSNKWLSSDGLRFILVFTGVGANDSWNSVAGRFDLLRKPPE